MSDGRIIIDTEIDNSGVISGVNSLSGVAKKGLSTVTKLAVAAGAAFSGMSAYAIKVGSDFEEGMSKVKAISGATTEELELLTEKAKEMGAKTKFSATESAEALSYMAMAGWKANDMLNGLEGIMNLAAASGEDLAMTSDIVTDALTAFGMKASESAHFADILAQASSNSNTNVAMLGESFKYVAPLAGSLKYSAEDTSIALGLMANSGIKASQAGTSLKTALVNMVKPSEKMQVIMDRYNLSLQNTDGSMKSLKEVIDMLREKFSGLDEATKSAAAAQLFGKESLAGMLAIINASDEDYKKLTESIYNCDGAAQQMAETMNDNLKGKITILKSGLEGLGIAAYEKFQEPMKKAVESASEAVSKLNESLNNGEMGEAITKIAESFGKLISTVADFLADHLPELINGLSWVLDHASEIAAGVIGISVAFKTMKTALVITTIVKAFKELGVASKVAAAGQWLFNSSILANPIVWIVGLIAGLIAALVTLYVTNEDFRNAITNAWKRIKEVASDVWGAIVEFFTEIIPDAFESMKSFFTETVPGFFSDMWDSITETFDNACDIVISFFTEDIPEAINGVAEWFEELPGRIGYALGALAGIIASSFVNSFNYLVKNIPVWIDNIVNWFAQLPGRIAEWLTNAWNDITQWCSDTYDTCTTWIGETVDSIVNWFSKLPGRIWTWLTDTINKISSWGSEMYNKATTAVGETVDSIIEWFKELPDKMYEIGVNIISGLWEGIKSTGSWIKNKIGDFCGGVKDGFTDFFDINSPSRLMRDLVGKNIVRGISVGIDGEMPDAIGNIKDNLDDLYYELRKTVDGEVAKTTSSIASNNYMNNTYITNNMSGNDSNKVIHTTINIDGRKFAEATGPYIDAELGNRQNTRERGGC